MPAKVHMSKKELNNLIEAGEKAGKGEQYWDTVYDYESCHRIQTAISLHWQRLLTLKEWVVYASTTERRETNASILYEMPCQKRNERC